MPPLDQIYDVAQYTPLQFASGLSRRQGKNAIYLKREDLQPVHSFKLRGAYNKIINLTDEQKKHGIIAASAGNHAQGVALAAQRLHIPALVIMPTTAPAIKVEAVKGYGAEVELFGNNYSEAAEYCKKRVRETGRTFIHPFDDPQIIAGQGTVGREIIEQLPDVTHIFVPVGGGGLIAGIAQCVKRFNPDIQIISVEPEDDNALLLSIQKGRRVELPNVGIFADGVAVKQIGKYTFEIASKLVDDFITVDDDQICAAIKDVFEETRCILEPAGALALAGAKVYLEKRQIFDAKVAVICSGANIAFERLQFVAERTLIGSGQEALFAVQLPEEPGALQNFCNDVVKDKRLTQFCYRLKNRQNAHIFIGIQFNDKQAKHDFTDDMKRHDYDFIDLSKNALAKDHVRYMIGGQSPAAHDEHFYTIKFSERPGALSEFLETLSHKWNICLFHYRSLGGDENSILIGFEASNPATLEKALQKTNYHFTPINHDPALTLFLK